MGMEMEEATHDVAPKVLVQPCLAQRHVFNHVRARPEWRMPRTFLRRTRFAFQLSFVF